MSENLPDIDDIFKRAFDAYNDAPGEQVWNNIDRRVSKRKAALFTRRYHRLKWIAAACLLFTAGMAMYLVHTRVNDNRVANGPGQQQPAPAIIVPAPSGRAPQLQGRQAGNNPGDATLGNNSTAAGHQPVVEATEVARDNTTAQPGNQSATAPVPTGKHQSTAQPSVQQGRNVAIRKKTASPAVAGSRNRITPSPKANNNQPAAINLAAGNGTAGNVASRLPTLPQATPLLSNIHSHNGEAVLPRIGVEQLLVPPPAFVNVMPHNNTLLAGHTEPTTTGLPLVKHTMPRKAQLRLYIAAAYTPEAITKSITNDRPRFREDARNDIRANETTVQSYSTGVLLGYRVGSNLAIETGLGTSTIVSEIRPKTIFARPDDQGRVRFHFNCTAGYSSITLKTGQTPAAGDSITALVSRNTLRYTNIPLNVRYNLQAGRFTVEPGVGLVYHILAKSNLETALKTQSAVEKTTVNQINGLKDNYLSTALSVRASYEVAAGISLAVTPAARWGVTAINARAPVKTRLNAYGVGVGLSVNL